jgi:hypothetical protein
VVGLFLAAKLPRPEEAPPAAPPLYASAPAARRGWTPIAWGPSPWVRLTRAFPALRHARRTAQTVVPFVAAACLAATVDARRQPWAAHLADYARQPGASAACLCLLWAVTRALRDVLAAVHVVEVAEVHKHGPAEAAGLRQGDRLVSVDGRDVCGRSLRALRRLLDDGEVGDVLQLSVVRRRADNTTTTSAPAASPVALAALAGARATTAAAATAVDAAGAAAGAEGEVVALEVVRDVVPATSVYARLLRNAAASAAPVPAVDGAAGPNSRRDGDDSGGGAVGYLLISEFTQRTLSDIETAIADLRHEAAASPSSPPTSKHPQNAGERLSPARVGAVPRLGALVIDLRGNLGGTLPSALDAASLFLPQGAVLMQMKGGAGARAAGTPSIPAAANATDGAAARARGTPGALARLWGVAVWPLASVASALAGSRGGAEDHVDRYRSTNTRADTRTPLLLLVDAQTGAVLVY